MSRLRYGMAGLAAVVAFVAGYLLLSPRVDIDEPGRAHQAADTPQETSDVTEMVAVVLPDLSEQAQIGQRAFTAKCAQCHGATAGGVLGSGPPLIHKIYEPSHHADESFYRAATLGVQAHHWPFGNMPPVEGMTRADVTEIITFIREVQRANGIQ